MESLSGAERLRIHHNKTGHRSGEHNALSLEFMTGHAPTADDVRNQPPCISCGVARITSNSNQKVRVVPLTEPGTDMASDLIVSLPRSVNGYVHVCHLHCLVSNYGTFVPLKNKECGDIIVANIKRMQNHTSRKLIRFHMDGGEGKTGKLKQFLSEQGTDLVVNLADVHSNTTIERRHRDVIDIKNAMMHTGNAPDPLWEFSGPQANHLVNINVSIAQIRNLKRLAKSEGQKADRPLTPFEMIECNGVRINMRKLWNNLHTMFAKCVGKIENVHVEKHGDKEFEGIYLGLIHSPDNVVQYGHYVLRYYDKKIVKVRTVKTYDNIFPFVMTPVRMPMSSSITDDSASGGESKEQLQEAKPPATQPTVHRGRIMAQEKFPPGTTAMTTQGECHILDRYKDGDYKVTFPDQPLEVRTVGRQHLWLSHDYPDDDHNSSGHRITPLLAAKPVPRMQSMGVPMGHADSMWQANQHQPANPMDDLAIEEVVMEEQPVAAGQQPIKEKRITRSNSRKVLATQSRV